MREVITLDFMIFIYLFEVNARYIDAVEDIFASVEQGTMNAVTSVISVIEALSTQNIPRIGGFVNILRDFSMN